MPTELMQEIPNFNSIKYENLINTLQKGTCIFIGAGVSKLAGYKLWDELKENLVERFQLKKGGISLDQGGDLDFSFFENLKKHSDIIESFDYLQDTDKKLFISELKSIFKSDERISSNKVYQVLNRLNNGKNFFVTTNVDKGFQKYLGITDDDVSIFPNFSNQLKRINYLHGRIDYEDSWIFTREQYNKGYIYKHAPCKKFLIDIFEHYNVLFVGYGLKEEEIKQAIYLTKKLKTHYWLEPYSRNTEDNLKIHSTSLNVNCNISLIPYSIDINNHKCLYKVIDRLYDAMTKIEIGGV